MLPAPALPPGLTLTVTTVPSIGLTTLASARFAWATVTCAAAASAEAWSAANCAALTGPAEPPPPAPPRTVLLLLLLPPPAVLLAAAAALDSHAHPLRAVGHHREAL